MLDLERKGETVIQSGLAHEEQPDGRTVTTALRASHRSKLVA